MNQGRQQACRWCSSLASCSLCRISHPTLLRQAQAANGHTSATLETGQDDDQTEMVDILAPSPSFDPEEARLYRQPSSAASLDPEDAALYRQDPAPASSPSLDPEDAELYGQSGAAQPGAHKFCLNQSLGDLCMYLVVSNAITASVQS